MCSIEGCGTRVYGRGWCEKHYTRWRRHGDPLKSDRATTDMTVEQQLLFLSREDKTTGCRVWHKTSHQNPYGVFKKQKPHRVAYETWVGPIPEGLIVRHKCDNPPCINPDHLETGTQADNIRDMVERGRYRHGRKYRGPKHVRASLTAKEAEAIRLEHEKGVLTKEMLAEAYGVSRTTIIRVTTGRRYT